MDVNLEGEQKVLAPRNSSFGADRQAKGKGTEKATTENKLVHTLFKGFSISHMIYAVLHGLFLLLAFCSKRAGRGPPAGTATEIAIDCADHTFCLHL
jgi:hypothetical protein